MKLSSKTKSNEPSFLVLSIVREQLHREPDQDDVFIMMSKNHRLVRMFIYDKVGSMLFEKKFHTDS